jgi:sulfur-carrier protein
VVLVHVLAPTKNQGRRTKDQLFDYPPALDCRPMRIHLLYFASFRDVAGKGDEMRDIPEGTSVAELWSGLCREIPKFGAFPSMPPAAVNEEYVGPEAQLHDSDEVAFLPPVAGG